MSENTSSKKKRNTNIVLGALIGVVIIALIYKFVIKPMQQAKADGTTTDGSSSTPLPSSSQLSKVGNNTILKRGSKAMEVMWVQSYYNQKVAVPSGKTKLVVDGVFGAKTETAVLFAIQKKTTSWAEFKARLDGGPMDYQNPSTDWNFNNQPTNEWEWQTAP